MMLDTVMELTREFEIFADYFQFIIMDESSQDNFNVAWTEEALERMLAISNTSVSLGTLRNVTVPVTICINQSQPQIDLEKFDHAVSGSLNIPSGSLVIMGCTDYLPDAPRIKLPAGTYRLLYLATGIETITYESDPADDHYIVHLWADSPQQPVLLKHWRTNT